MNRKKVRTQQGQIWTPATVLKNMSCQDCIVYKIVLHTLEGKVYRRKRKHLLKTKEQEFTTTCEQTDFLTESNTNVPLEKETNAELPVVVKLTHHNDSPERQSKPPLVRRSGREVKMPSRFKDYEMH